MKRILIFCLCLMFAFSLASANIVFAQDSGTMEAEHKESSPKEEAAQPGTEMEKEGEEAQPEEGMPPEEGEEMEKESGEEKTEGETKEE